MIKLFFKTESSSKMHVFDLFTTVYNRVDSPDSGSSSMLCGKAVLIHYSHTDCEPALYKSSFVLVGTVTVTRTNDEPVCIDRNCRHR